MNDVERALLPAGLQRNRINGPECPIHENLP